jgi:membrane protease YdiL (CAAX protease family)
MFQDIDKVIYKQIIFLGLAIMFGLLLFGGGGLVLARAFWSEGDILAASSYILDTPERLNFMRYLQFLTMLGTFFFPAVALAAVTPKPLSFLYLDRKIDGQHIIMLMVMLIIVLPLVNALMIWNQGLHLPESMAALEEWMRDKEAQLGSITEKFVMTGSFTLLGVNLLVMAVLPALGEEFIFRGILMKWFSRSMNIHWAIILSAFIFSAIHMQFLGFFPRLFLGIVLGYVFYWSGSLWASVWLHFLNNAMTVIMYFLVARGLVDIEPETVGTIDSGLMLLVNTLIFFAAMYWFWAKRKEFRL